MSFNASLISSNLYLFVINLFSGTPFLIHDEDIAGISLSGQHPPPQLPSIFFPLINSWGESLICSPSGGWDAKISFPVFLINEKPNSIVSVFPADSTQ